MNPKLRTLLDDVSLLLTRYPQAETWADVHECDVEGLALRLRIRDALADEDPDDHRDDVLDDGPDLDDDSRLELGDPT